LIRGLTEKDPEKAAAVAEQLEDETRAALENLRDLARGIYPPLLADQGLGAALEAQARRSPVRALVEAGGLGRYSPEVEAALYFSCLEALQNVAKYSEARSVRVTLAEEDGVLSFEVVDDGRGFDPAATGYGTGLQGMADRLAAIDGRLVVRSGAGEGTSVRGSVGVINRTTVSA
jgi:signal transduction histidine kinase